MSKENTESQKRVKELLLQGLSRSDIATAAKVTPQYVSAIRKKLEKQLKMPLDRYLAQKGAAPTPSKIAAAPTRIEAKEEVLAPVIPTRPTEGVAPPPVAPAAEVPPEEGIKVSPLIARIEAEGVPIEWCQAINALPPSVLVYVTGDQNFMLTDAEAAIGSDSWKLLLDEYLADILKRFPAFIGFALLQSVMWGTVGTRVMAARFAKKEEKKVEEKAKEKEVETVGGVEKPSGVKVPEEYSKRKR